MAIYFVRHGQSEANVRQVLAGGKQDSPLTDKGREQALQAAHDLRTVHIDRIISSPLQRARETAQIIARELHIDPESIDLDPRIVEYDVGSLVGRPLGSVNSRQLTTAPGAEDPVAFQQRVLNFLREYKNKPGVTLVVSHGGVSCLIEAARQGVDPSFFYDLPSLPNAKATRLDLG